MEKQIDLSLPCLICGGNVEKSTEDETVVAENSNFVDLKAKFGIKNHIKKLNDDQVFQCFLKLFKVNHTEGSNEAESNVRDDHPPFEFCGGCKDQLGNLLELQFKLDELTSQINIGLEQLKGKMEKSEGQFESEAFYKCYPGYRRVRKKIVGKESAEQDESISNEPDTMATDQEKLEPEADWSPSSPASDFHEPDNCDDGTEKPPRKLLKFKECPEKNLLIYGDFTFQFLESIDEKKGQVKCTRCDEMIPHNKGYIRRHVAKVHTDRFVCPYCPSRFPTAPRLRFHVQGVHEGKPKKRRIVECKICGKSVTSGDTRRRHEWTHKSKEEKEEALKDPAFADELPWSVLHSEKRYQCDKCEDRFSSTSALKKHLERKHKDPSERRQLCPECGRTVLNLGIHMRHHHSDNGGVVDLMKTCLEPGCGKRFLNLGALTRHKNQVHRKLKPFECTQCGKCFGDKGYLKHHMKVMHKKESMK